jgi:4-carboxymuconolactone decarboxylase
MGLSARELEHASQSAHRLQEVALMVHLFAGYPRGLAALAQAVQLGRLPPMPETVQLASGDRERGMGLFRQVYGEVADRVADQIRDLHPDALHWVLTHAYGRVLNRPGLSLAEREVLAVAALTALGSVPQLKGHVVGAIRCGASGAALRDAVDQITDLAEPEHVRTARAFIDGAAEAD